LVLLLARLKRRKGSQQPNLPQACTNLDVFIGEAGEDRPAFRADCGRYDHAVGFDSAEFAGGEIDDDRDFAADELLRLIKLRDAGTDLSDFCADVNGEF
jgi:hypothetical protein